MIEVYARVFVANAQSCRTGDQHWAVVHACKSPCHQRAVGYTGTLPGTHPHYLVLEKAHDLYLNIIDPPVPLFKPLLFIRFLAFAGQHWKTGKKLLIHCNQGESRAPSLALLFLAKSCRGVNHASYEAAREDFQLLYPLYQPGKGIQDYLTQNWDTLEL